MDRSLPLGFCKIYHFGIYDNFNVMVMDLLGPSLQHLFEKCNGRFSIPTTLRLAIHLLSIIKTLHERSIIHRFYKKIYMLIVLKLIPFILEIFPLGILQWDSHNVKYFAWI